MVWRSLSRILNPFFMASLRAGECTLDRAAPHGAFVRPAER
jgi:hypothetical protein